MSNTDKWDSRFMEMAELVSTWSKDPSTQIGVVIVDPLRRIVSTGYNGFPRGLSDAPERYEERSVKYAHIVHGELNAILSADSRRLEGASRLCERTSDPLPGKVVVRIATFGVHPTSSAQSNSCCSLRATLACILLALTSSHAGHSRQRAQRFRSNGS